MIKDLHRTCRNRLVQHPLLKTLPAKKQLLIEYTIKKTCIYDTSGLKFWGGHMIGHTLCWARGPRPIFEWEPLFKIPKP